MAVDLPPQAGIEHGTRSETCVANEVSVALSGATAKPTWGEAERRVRWRGGRHAERTEAPGRG